MSKEPTYLDSYANIVLTVLWIVYVEKPQCLLCLKVLENRSLKPSILKQRMEASHPVHASDNCATFRAKRDRF